jgi:hypothetical protein
MRISYHFRSGVSENGDASAPAPVVDRDLHPYSIRVFLNAIHLDDLSASRSLGVRPTAPGGSLATRELLSVARGGLIAAATEARQARYEGDVWEDKIAVWAATRESASVAEVLEN